MVFNEAKCPWHLRHGKGSNNAVLVCSHVQDEAALEAVVVY